MSEPLLCLCGHDDGSHDESLGFCNAKDCRCVCFRLLDEGFDDDEEELPEELDFGIE